MSEILEGALVGLVVGSAYAAIYFAITWRR